MTTTEFFCVIFIAKSVTTNNLPQKKKTVNNKSRWKPSTHKQKKTSSPNFTLSCFEKFAKKNAV